MAEFHGAGIAAVLAADTKLQVRIGGAALLCGHGHKLAHALLIQLSKRIGLVDLVLIVRRQELSGVVAGEAEGHLRQVVGTEGEELSLLCDLVGSEAALGISIIVPIW